MGKDDRARVSANGFLFCNDIKLDCDTCEREHKFPDMKCTLEQELDYSFELESIDDLHFELTQLGCFVEDVHLNPFIEFSDCSKYKISFNKQKIEDGTTNTGMVKIAALYDTEKESDLVKYTAVVIGREFKTQAKQQLLLDV